MTCGPFQIGCQIGQFLDPYWFWIQAGFWIVLALACLWALSLLKNVAGWQGVAGALTVAGYLFGWIRGKRDKPLIPRVENLTELEDGPDVDPPRGVKPKRERRKLFPNAPWNR